MKYDYILKTVQDVIQETGSRNLEEICSYYGVEIRRHDLKRKLKAYFYYNPADEIPFIVIDLNVSDIFYRILLAHEIGHYFLHRQEGIVHAFCFQEFDVLEMNVIQDEEYEANLFAAELLLEDSNVMEALHSNSFFTAAAMLKVPAALLDFKVRNLQSKGQTLYTFSSPKASFLKEDCGAYNAYNYNDSYNDFD